MGGGGVAALLVGNLAAGCASLPPPRTPEEALYRKRCGNCHTLHAANEYTRTDWKKIMVQMSTNAGLTDAEAAGLLKWLEANSSDKVP